MSIAKKSMIALAAALITTAFSAPSFSEDDGKDMLPTDQICIHTESGPFCIPKLQTEDGRAVAVERGYT